MKKQCSKTRKPPNWGAFLFYATMNHLLKILLDNSLNGIVEAGTVPLKLLKKNSYYIKWLTFVTFE